MRWIEANGAVLRHELAGGAAGDATLSSARTVVLIHEAGGALDSWDAVVPALQGRYRTLRYDQRGFGMSEQASSLTLEGMVADLAGLLDALQIDAPCHLAGTAIGASIALAFAATFPERVASVVASSPVTGGLPESAKAGLEQRAQLLEREGMRAIADTSLQRSYPEHMRRDSDRFTQYRNRFLGNDARSFAALSRSFTSIDLCDSYSNIVAPTLVIGCTEDGLKPASECARLAALLPQGRYAEVNSGHFLGVQSPESFVNLLLPFLEEIDATY